MRKTKDLVRHKWEKRMVRVAVIVAVLSLVLIGEIIMSGKDMPDWAQILIFSLVALPIVTPFFLQYMYWREASDAIEISQDQYPELYSVYLEQVSKANMGYTPKLYVKNGNGLLDAFATKGGLRKNTGYIVVYSDIIDTFYDLNDKVPFRYIVSHELGHLKLGHVNVRRIVLMSVLRPVFLNDSLSRAQEYSADRFGASITNNIATRSLSVIFAGKRNYKSLNIQKYIEHDTKHINRFWVAIVNFRAGHAIGRRRLAAAYRMDAEGWQNVHGKML